MNRLTIEYRRLDDIRPYENNPRENENAVGAVAESLRRFGFRSPILLDRDGVIICGHTRYMAARLLKKEEVPCVVLDHLTEDQVRAFRLADNKVAEKARWDDDLLLQELSQIVDIDMTVFGFEKPTVKEDNFSEPPPKHPITQRGDLWLLGRHRLMCGDATNASDLRILMDGKLADALVTDPPYNVDYESNGAKIMNDAMPDDRFRAFLSAAFFAADAVMKPGAVFYIWHADSEGYNFRAACAASGWTVRRCLIWVKNCPVLGRQDYLWKHEPCLMGWKDGAEPLWAMDGNPLTTLLRFNRPTKSADHPTMKPVLLFDRLIQTNTREGDIVLDSFGGSGTAVIACEQNGRIAHTLELDPKYADVIVRRYIDLVGSDHDVFLLRGGKRHRKSELEETKDAN